MKGGTVQINWHDTKPVLTLDFHPFSNLLATGGADFDIKLWLLNSGEGQKNVPNASYQSSLSYHGSAINCLRFSPSGEQLASGADGGELIIWKLHHLENGQTWKVLKTLSFHRKDVLDLQWSNDGAYLISGSVDNSCLIWDVSKGSVHQILDAHLHYVQGVALDPLGKYAASLSSDRSCRIYVNKPPTKIKSIEKMNYVCQHVITKAEHLSIDSKSARNHFFHDETLPSFFRRLAWSPDGSFLLVPAGICKMSPASEPINTAYIFSRKDLSRPAVRLPSASKPVVAVRFCPKLFSLRGLNPAGFFKLPYRIIFAVVTLNSLYIYDTESAPPLAIMAGLHYAAITDVAWSADAHYLALSSQDGYCTLVEFENDELGSPYALSEDKICTIDGKISSSQKPDDLTSEAIRSDDQNRKQESESVEQPSPIQKLDDLTGEVIGSGDQNRKMEVEGNKVKQEESKSVKKSCSIQKLDDLIGEAIGSDDQNRKTEVKGNEVKQKESKSVEKLNLIQKLDDLTGEAIGSDDQNRKREARAEENEVKQEESKRVNNMVIEEASSGDNVVALDSRGNEMEKNASKQASLSSSRSDHVSSKPAKRRITPVAIDP